MDHSARSIIISLIVAHVLVKLSQFCNSIFNAALNCVIKELHDQLVCCLVIHRQEAHFMKDMRLLELELLASIFDPFTLFLVRWHLVDYECDWNTARILKQTQFVSQIFDTSFFSLASVDWVSPFTLCIEALSIHYQDHSMLALHVPLRINKLFVKFLLAYGVPYFNFYRKLIFIQEK